MLMPVLIYGVAIISISCTWHKNNLVTEFQIVIARIENLGSLMPDLDAILCSGISVM